MLGCTIDICHIAPFLRVSYEKYLKKYLKKYSEDLATELAIDRTKDELKAGVQTMRYQITTLQSSNGQSPFVTVFLNIKDGDEYEKEQAAICEEMIKQRIDGMKNPKGQIISEEFPKLVYLLDKNNCLEGGKYDYITKLACICNTKRMSPDFLSAKKLREDYGDIVPPMGCRSFLTKYEDPETGKLKWYGRYNSGVITLNLPQIGLISKGDMDIFWKLLDERCELCKEALLFRHSLLRGQKASISPIHWQGGGIARLKSNDVIDPYLFNNYSTLSLGYIGIYEMTQAMVGVSHTDPKGKEFALKVMKFLNDKCAKWREEYNIGFSLYGTPGENTLSKMCAIDKQRFGVIENVTDKEYYTNSYHVCVTEEIDAFSKLKFESEFQSLSPGGCISYVEIPNMEKNIEAVEQLVNFIYHNIRYAELNSRPDVCYKCGFHGEFKVHDDLTTWECPNCGNTDKSEMQVLRRTCGYIGSNFWSKGRTAEIKDRVLHL